MVQTIFDRKNNGHVMGNFLQGCKQKGRRKIAFVSLSLPEDGYFYRS